MSSTIVMGTQRRGLILDTQTGAGGGAVAARRQAGRTGRCGAVSRNSARASASAGRAGAEEGRARNARRSPGAASAKPRAGGRGALSYMRRGGRQRGGGSACGAAAGALRGMRAADPPREREQRRAAGARTNAPARARVRVRSRASGPCRRSPRYRGGTAGPRIGRLRVPAWRALRWFDGASGH